MKTRLPRPRPRSPQTVHSIVVKHDFIDAAQMSLLCKGGLGF